MSDVQLTLEQAIDLCIEASVEFFGGSNGAFSPSLARTIGADAELQRRGLGVAQLGLGIHQKAGHPDKLQQLAHDAASGDAQAFEAAMRYVALRLFHMPELPSELAALAANVLTGRTPRPPMRRAKESGLSGRNIAVYALVEICTFQGVTASQGYQLVADAIRKKGWNPNSSLTVKKVHLATRKAIPHGLTVHEAMTLASFPFLPPSIHDLLTATLGKSFTGEGE